MHLGQWVGTTYTFTPPIMGWRNQLRLEIRPCLPAPSRNNLRNDPWPQSLADSWVADRDKRGPGVPLSPPSGPIWGAGGGLIGRLIVGTKTVADRPLGLAP